MGSLFHHVIITSRVSLATVTFDAMLARLQRCSIDAKHSKTYLTHKFLHFYAQTLFDPNALDHQAPMFTVKSLVLTDSVAADAG